MSTLQTEFSAENRSKLRAWNLKQISDRITSCSMPTNQFYKLKKVFAFAAKLCVFIFCCILTGAAQDLDIKIKILPSSPVRVEEKILNPQIESESLEISFPKNYADVSELGTRLADLELFDETGAKIEFKKLAAGEFRAEKPPAILSYNVKVEVPENPASAAHVSWLAAKRGILMTGDLLPQWKDGRKVSAKITFELPNNWKITSRETKTSENVFAVEDVEKAIFLVGQNQREKTTQIDKTDLNLAISGEWKFSDDEALEMATEILMEYRKMFGAIPTKQAQIFLLPFPSPLSPPRSVNSDRWRAETRGATVTIISGAIASKREAVQRLHEQLRHEIFHLWIPNAVNLTGNYDWFYEGFTVYQALRTGVFMNQIRFEDYLNTLAAAFDLAKNQNVSLLEISNRRWLGGNNSVYAKGMVTAFLCDLAILDQSNGKHSLTEIFQKVYRKYHASNVPTDGSAAVLEILKSYPELQTIVQNYIEGAMKIEWRNELERFGIEVFESGDGTQLKVTSAPSGRQKDLLDKLGYNQWRKLLRTKK
ncbi:MAG: hypothetical protein ACR2LT_09055 [Pyrinomonadaceae bacterium]